MKKGPGKDFLTRYERMWQVQFENLQRFKKWRGRWPSPTERFPGRTQIGQWLYRNRQAFFEGRLSKSRIQQLRAIGCPINPIRHVDGKWMEQLERLRQFRTRHPGRWPYTAEEFPKGNKLGRWFHEQRLRNTRGTLKKSWVRHLRSIGFPFRIKIIKRKELWRTRYEELKAFRKNNPGRWPVKSDHPAKENVLGSWCHAQRTKRKKGMLSRERLRLLDALGFEWRPMEASWMRNFLSLREFLRSHSGKNPSTNSLSGKERTLAAWQAFQKQRIRTGKMNALRKTRLSKLRGTGHRQSLAF